MAALDASNAALQEATAPALEDYGDEVVEGLERSPKRIHCKFLYDERGSKLFDRICELEEYYPTRTELEIMRRHAGEMAALLGPGCLVVECGSGSSRKTPLLLDALDEPAAYVPIDISREHLLRSAERLRRRYPGLEIAPLVADYTQPIDLPPIRAEARRRVVYFPGSTIGNFETGEAIAFLARLARFCGPGGALLVGVDLDKEREVLERAYDDAKGVTAAFNLNLLRRFNRELGADFDLEGFRHRAVYNPEETRVEMYLESLRDQTVRVGGVEIDFARGELVHTESSHKYSLEKFRDISRRAGLEVERVWTDPEDLFSVQYLTVGE